MSNKIKLHEFIEKKGSYYIASNLGVSLATVSYWRNYLSYPRPHHFEKLQKLSKNTIDFERSLRVYVSKKTKDI